MSACSSKKLAPRSVRVGAIALLGGLTVAGCRHPSTGSGAPGDLVDSSWTTAAESCWPDLIRNGFHAQKIERNLAVPANFRSTFPAYAAQSDAQISALLTRTVGSAPPADSSKLQYSQTPVLTSGQAATGTSPQAAVAANAQGIAPPGALCAIQTGTPVGFR